MRREQSTHSSDAVSASRQVAGFRRQRCDKVGERVLERSYTLLFEGVPHVGHVDTDIAEPAEDVRRVTPNTPPRLTETKLSSILSVRAVASRSSQRSASTSLRRSP